jgi:uncharacterized caspase-like protein
LKLFPGDLPVLRAVLVSFGLVFSVPVWAADRVALVFGMADYASIEDLSNTHSDALGISDTLSSIGFEVSTHLDIGGAEMREVLDEFAITSETADLALIYFAGHGVEVQGENFFIPADADVSSNQDIQAQALTLTDFLDAVDRARKMRIVILDSCRDNPFGDQLSPLAVSTGTQVEGARGGGGGLAPANPDRGTLVAYAARDGQVAFDGSGGNSPYAKALIDILPRKDLEISLMFRQVRDVVLQATYNQQEPHTYGSLTGIPFFLAGTSEDDTRVASSDPRVAWASLRSDQATQLAALAKTGDTRSLLGLAYIRLNPDGSTFAPGEAFNLLSQAAKTGSAEAQYELAKLFEQGIGTNQDEERALALYRQAADQDFADAINDLGFLTYQGGLGLRQDPAAALRLFERAADLRHPQAMYNFAALIDDGLIPTKGARESAQYLYQALRTGSSDVLQILTERPTMFTAATRRELQTILADNAHYDGAIDGDFGNGTKRGLRRAYGIEE